MICDPARRILFLTGSPTRFGEDRFTEDDAFLPAVRQALLDRGCPRTAGGDPAPRTLLVSAAPDDAAFNRSVHEGMGLCIRKSGIFPEPLVMLDRSNASKAAALVRSADWVILCGGHVPTQNRFLHETRLREILQGYGGVVMGCSAGSMNCADRVYSHPELPGEADDPAYSRWLRGLGLTDINLIPHIDQIRPVRLDGRRLVEDIILPDSWQHRFTAIPDGGYVRVENGRARVFGPAWELSDGSIKPYTSMNFVFISPHFPQTYAHFCSGLRANGVRVLGIADAPYESLSDELRGALTEYYRVNNLENYDEVFRALAFLSFKYGKIDWIESNNEYWLEQDARLRTDFNVSTGIRNDRIASIKEKSEMKKYYAAGGIPTARQIKCAEGLETVLAFTKRTGYPVIAKPDNGVGASETYKLHSDDEVKDWFSAHPADFGAFVLEEFVTGLLVSYDAIVDASGDPLFENMSVFPTPIMDIVGGQLDIAYYAAKKVPAALADAGRRTVKAFGIRSRFVHLEFFRLDRDREGLGKKGDYVGLEVNMRPPGGYTPDMMNYAHSTDVFQIWADMVAFDQARKPQGEQFYCAYAGRRDCHRYVHSENEVRERYSQALCTIERVPGALSSALCDTAFMARFATQADMQAYFDFVLEKA